jgi:hypothetical protein
MTRDMQPEINTQQTIGRSAWKHMDAKKSKRKPEPGTVKKSPPILMSCESASAVYAETREATMTGKAASTVSSRRGLESRLLTPDPGLGSRLSICTRQALCFSPEGVQRGFVIFVQVVETYAGRGSYAREVSRPGICGDKPEKSGCIAAGVCRSREIGFVFVRTKQYLPCGGLLRSHGSTGKTNTDRRR